MHSAAAKATVTRATGKTAGRRASPHADLFERAAEAAFAGARPLARNAYKVTLGKALVRRAQEATVV